ncbi:Uncharacterized protein FWK35_00019575 [Aphis craccivora]|uniref:Uncharacterized protein n=1 Tax=Aphis craccivora TaxID=307492 RepID=A0A6G0Y2H7_APHCR|nr:Uncharacterized protein FWK35_00019575 [Aphis craccivora]
MVVVIVFIVPSEKTGELYEVAVLVIMDVWEVFVNTKELYIICLQLHLRVDILCQFWILEKMLYQYHFMIPKNAILTRTSWETFLSTRGKQIPLRHVSKAKIHVQPTSISRRRLEVTGGSKRLAVGRPPSGEKRCLQINVNKNQPNAKSHGTIPKLKIFFIYVQINVYNVRVMVNGNTQQWRADKFSDPGAVMKKTTHRCRRILLPSIIFTFPVNSQVKVY